MSESAGRVVTWQWERFISYGIGGGGHWEVEYGEEHPEILFQEDLKDPKKYRNLRALVPEQLLVDCETQRDLAIASRDWNCDQRKKLEAAVRALIAGVRAISSCAGRTEPFVYVREVDAGTDNACWVIANAVDPGAIPLFDTPSLAGGGEVGDIDRCRQWFDSVQDVNPQYLEQADYELAARLYLQLGMRIPSSIGSKLDAAIDALHGAGARGGES